MRQQLLWWQLQQLEQHLSVKLGLLAVALVASACIAPQKTASRPNTRPAMSDSPRPPPTKVAAVSSPRTANDATPNPQAVAEAQDLLKQGLAAYHIGAYDDAENLLKRSITVYPFLAPANLALGKIFLLKGAATHDESLIQSARLMFEMAHNNDPSLREPLILLELFKPRADAPAKNRE